MNLTSFKIQLVLPLLILMNDRTLKTRLGSVVVLAGVIAVSLLIMFEAFPNLRANGYEIMIQFPTAPGVRESTTVRKAVLKLGVSLMWNSNQTGAWSLRSPLTMK